MSVRPLLAKNCYACHTGSRLGGLRVDSREDLLKGGNNGPAVVPGNPDASLLIQAVTRKHERFQMPPSAPLAEQEISSLVHWVKTGAVWPKEPMAPKLATKDYVITPEQRAFWAFKRVRKPTSPEVKDPIWARSALDRFVLAKLESNGLEPVSPVGKRVLLRRASLDLIGLPPSPEEVDAFESDSSPGAFAKVVDRLLASPQYGERWGRYWLDLARYADGQLGASRDTPYVNAFRYRDWVIRAFNEDMAYDTFVKAQIAADLWSTPDREKLMPGLGFQALGDRGADQVDVTTRTFLALTVGCAQCHDHKYDPIPTKDYYSLLGILHSSENHEYPLAPEAEVQTYKMHKKQIDELQEKIDDFIRERSTELGEMLARKTARYMTAAWDVAQGTSPDSNLDREIVDRWVKYLEDPQKEHSFLKGWAELKSRVDAQKFAGEFQAFVVAMFAEKREMDDRNYVKLGGAKGAKDERTRQYTNLESLAIEKYYLWRDLASDPFMRNGVLFPGGIYYYGLPSSLKRDFETRGGAIPTVKDIDPYLHGEWKEHLDSMRGELAALKKTLPPQYPFLHALRDSQNPANVRVAIRGDAENLGEEAPRRFLQILCEDTPKPITAGSGRLELAEVIADPRNPLTARVIVNRVWQLHFGEGIVRSVGNFGQLGERPTHPELLDYLASQFVENGWSIKKLHREIMLSATYALSTDHKEQNYAKDPENRLLWRFSLRPRLDAEALRDSMLFVSGSLDTTIGGPPVLLNKGTHRRTVYGYVGRTTLDPMLALFDFPNPNSTSERRSVTAGPLQRLFFMNNSFVAEQANALAERLKRSGSDDVARIRHAYRLVLGRVPTAEEHRWGQEFLRTSENAWPQYAQALLSSSEFMSLN